MKKIMKKLSPRILVSALILALLVVLGMLKWDRDTKVRLKTKVIPDIVAKLVSDPSVKVKGITNFKKVSGVYQFELNLDFNGTIRQFTSYMTKDGKIFFTAGTIVSEIDSTQTAAGTEQQKKLTCDDVTKKDLPKVTAFIVSNCPFGLQMQRTMNKAIGEQPKLADVFDVKYIGSIENGKITSMHGDAEAQENLRQICIREEQKSLYWPYVACYMKEGKSDSCVSEVGINKGVLSSCMTDSSRGLAFAQKDFDLGNKFNIGSSPTLLVNDSQIVSEFDFGGRTAEALKTVACCGSTTQGAYCATSLSTDSVATSFSVTGAALGGTSSAANCAPAN